MPLELNILGAPAWDRGAAEGVTAAAAEALRVLDEQWRTLDRAFWNVTWIGPERQAFNDRYTGIRRQVERLRDDLAAVPGRVNGAADEADRSRRRIAHGLHPVVGVATDLVDLLVD